MSFETVLMVDWSGGKAGPEKPKKDAIWMCEARGGASQEPAYVRDRVRAEALLAERIELALHEGERLIIGFDFPFGYPAGFAEALTGSADPLALWSDFAERFAPSADGGARWEKAAEINASLPGDGPFWNCPPSVKLPQLSQLKPTRPAFPEWRAAEEDVAARLKNRASSCWKLFTPGSVGSQALLGISVLARLRQRFAGHVAAWPFEPLTPPIAFVEIWPSLIARDVDAGQRAGEIKDAAQVRILAEAVSRLAPGELSEMLDVDAPEEGWIFGLGHEATLSAAARQGRLRNDCFAMPPGVAWAPVDEALAHLKGALVPITGSEEAPLSDAAGRILAADITAKRAHPPKANAAVDGYAVLGGLGASLHHIPLAPGRAAAGAPFAGSVPEGHALRILTGAQMPMGADTVILEEDCRVTDTQISVEGPLKTGANARKGGEDVEARATILKVGRRLTAPDLALLSATGHGAAPVRQQLRVAILSTGDEVVEAGSDIAEGQIFDANRPMLAALLRQMGHEVIDLGISPDDPAALRAAFDAAAKDAHALITSGGASAGDEDHVSALLNATGTMGLWRIAVKPGRPLALGLWKGAPVFGLPGNPVAALVCTLIFARPALSVLAGAGWREPEGFDVPAAFTKAKKPGRREYLRARIRDGAAQVFPSEGSGRITSLSWAEGLVELPDGARDITPGTPVRYLPFSGLMG